MAANNQLDVYKIILKKKKGFNFKTLITSRYVVSFQNWRID